MLDTCPTSPNVHPGFTPQANSCRPPGSGARRAVYVSPGRKPGVAEETATIPTVHWCRRTLSARTRPRPRVRDYALASPSSRAERRLNRRASTSFAPRHFLSRSTRAFKLTPMPMTLGFASTMSGWTAFLVASTPARISFWSSRICPCLSLSFWTVPSSSLTS